MTEIYLIQTNYLDYDEEGVGQWVRHIALEHPAFANQGEAQALADRLTERAVDLDYQFYVKDFQVVDEWLASRQNVIEHARQEGNLALVQWATEIMDGRTVGKPVSKEEWLEGVYVKEHFYDVVEHELRS